MRRSFAVIGGTVAALAAGVLVAVPAAQAVNIEQAVVVNDNPADFTPQVLDGAVSAIVQVGTKIVIGGTFTRVQNAGGGTTYPRPYLAAFDATSGLVDPAFAPQLDGKVTSMEAVGTSVIVGGWFNTVNGVTQRGITKISTITGARDVAFTASLDRSVKGSIVNGVAVRGSRAYIGGRFVGVNKVPRSSLAALNIMTGAPDASFNIPVTGTRVTGEPTSVGTLAVSANGASMVLAGNFTAVGGQPRSQIAMVAAASNAVSSWATGEYADACTTTASQRSYIRDIDFSPDASYFVVVTSGGKYANSLCDTAARWDATRTGSGQLPTWIDETGGDTLTAVAITGTAVYVGGHQKYLNNCCGTLDPATQEAIPGPGAVERVGIAALDPVSGVPFDWNPGRDRGEGVFDMLSTADGLWVGSDTEGIGTPRETRARIAFFPVAGGTTIRQPVPTNLPNTLFLAQSDDSLVKRSFTGSAVGAASPVANPGGVAWGSVTGAFMAAGRVYYTRSNGELWSAPFNGSTVGAATNTNSWFDFTGVTGATFLNGRLYYAKNNDGRLYFRMFSPVSDIVGSREIVAAVTGFAGAHTLFAGGGYVFFSNATNGLFRATPGPNGVLAGAAVSVPTPGMTWDAPAAFVDSAALQQIKRIYGPDRIATSLASAQDQFSAGSADAVVLARADVFADGLPGAALAGDKNAPLLLTMPALLDGRVADEIARVLPAGRTVYLLGGTGALSTSVENAVKAIPGKSYTVTRLAGINRYATSVAIANAVSSPSRALLATGSNFPDALGAGAAAGANDGVVLLTANTTLDPTVTAYLNAHSGLEVWAVGGPAVTAAGSRVPAARQVKGLNRYDTAAKLAASLFSSPTKVVLATGSNFPDGLSGGGYAANEGAPLLLVGPTTLPTETKNYLVTNADSITSGVVFGGPLVVYESVVAAAELAIN